MLLQQYFSFLTNWWTISCRRHHG